VSLPSVLREASAESGPVIGGHRVVDGGWLWVERSGNATATGHHSTAYQMIKPW
jgi:hypothetical protein